MLIFHKRSFIACSIMTALLSYGACATPQPDSWYVGAKVGWVSASTACESHATDCDDSATGVGLFGGYVLNDWLVFEAGYDYLGEISATYPAIGFPAQSAIYKGEIQGLSFVAKPYWQINDSWSLFGKAGTMLWDMDVTGDEVNFTHEADDRDWSPLLGGGVEYAFNRNWSTTLEYQWVNNVGGSGTGGTDINAVNLGVIYRFAAAPIPAPAPAPKPVEPPPAPVTKKQESWTLEGPSFASNSSVISPQLELALQPALERLQASSQAHLNIYTHTDSRGSDEFNMRLSDRRAQSVLKYFTQHGVMASQLTAQAMGESQPIADNNTEEGRYKNRRVELVSPAFTVEPPAATTPASEGQ